MSIEKNRQSLEDRVQEELADSLDEELKLELGGRPHGAPARSSDRRFPGRKFIDRRLYFTELLRLQRELIKLQGLVVPQAQGRRAVRGGDGRRQGRRDQAW